MISPHLGIRTLNFENERFSFATQPEKKCLPEGLEGDKDDGLNVETGSFSVTNQSSRIEGEAETEDVNLTVPATPHPSLNETSNTKDESRSSLTCEESRIDSGVHTSSNPLSRTISHSLPLKQSDYEALAKDFTELKADYERKCAKIVILEKDLKKKDMAILEVRLANSRNLRMKSVTELEKWGRVNQETPQNYNFSDESEKPTVDENGFKVQSRSTVEMPSNETELFQGLSYEFSQERRQLQSPPTLTAINMQKTFKESQIKLNLNLNQQENDHSSDELRGRSSSRLKDKVYKKTHRTGNSCPNFKIQNRKANLKLQTSSKFANSSEHSNNTTILTTITEEVTRNRFDYSNARSRSRSNSGLKKFNSIDENEFQFGRPGSPSRKSLKITLQRLNKSEKQAHSGNLYLRRSQDSKRSIGGVLNKTLSNSNIRRTRTHTGLVQHNNDLLSPLSSAYCDRKVMLVKNVNGSSFLNKWRFMANEPCLEAGTSPMSDEDRLKLNFKPPAGKIINKMDLANHK